MATSEMIQELIRAHVSGDADRFRQVAMQVAAREARSGHRLSAGKIRDLIDDPPPKVGTGPTPITRPTRDLQGVLSVKFPEFSFGDIILEGEAEKVVSRVLEEHHAEGRLREWGLSPARRLLLFGPPGCGKTLCSSVISAELGLPLFRVRVETLFSRFMGETALLLNEIFDQASNKRGVYLFDEFDSIGKHRGDSNDVGEAKRIVSTFLQLLDGDESNSVFIAATNEIGSLDRALFRRFDEVVPFSLPSEEALDRLIRLRVASYGFSQKDIANLSMKARGLSYADTTVAIQNSVKTMVLEDRRQLEPDDVSGALEHMVGRSEGAD